MANAFTVAAAQANAANEERYKQGMSLWDEIIARYQPGGAFGAGALASYERGKTQALGAGMQQLVSSGLSNTTVAATMGKKYEEEVGSPFRQQLADMQMGRLTEAQMGKADFIAQRQDIGPDPNMAMQSGMQAGYAQGAQQQDYGPSPWDDDFLGGGWGVDTPWGNNYTPRTSGGGGGGGSSGGSGLKPSQRVGSTSAYNPGGLNVAQFTPTGAGGEAKEEAPAAPAANDPTQGGKYPHRTPVLGVPWAPPGSIGRAAYTRAMQKKMQMERTGGVTGGVTGAQVSGYSSAGQGRY